MFKGILKVVISYALMLFSLLLMISLVKFSPNDLIFYTTAINSSYTNVLGALGVQIASPFVFFYGYSSWIWALCSLLVGINILVGITPRDLLIRFTLVHGIALLCSTLFSLFTSNFSFLTGGIFGALIGHVITSIIPNFVMIPIVLALLIVLLAKMWPYPFEQLAQMVNSLEKASQPILVIEEFGEYRDELPQENLDTSELRIPISDSVEKIPQQYYATQDEDMHYGAVDTLTEELEPNNFKYQSQLPSFLQEIDERESSEQTPPVFICKKPLGKEKEKETLLREVEVDLLSPYLRGSSSFYDRIEENNFLKLRSLEALESSTTLEEDVQNITEGLDELDQSFESMSPTSEWVKESGAPLSSFIRNQPGVKRLSFSNGIVGEVNEVSETQIPSDEREDGFNTDFMTNTTANISTTNADTDDEISVQDLIEESAEIIFNAEPPVIPQHTSKFPPVSTYISDTPIILNELDDKGEALPSFSLEHFDISSSNMIDNGVIEISDSEKMLLSGIERTMKKQQESSDSLKERLQKKQQQLADAFYKTQDQEKPTAFSNEEPTPAISNFVLQDVEKEILALKKESNVLDTVSQNISDNSFLMAHDLSDSEPIFDPLGDPIKEPLFISENNIDSEKLIQELMIPNAENIESLLTTSPTEEDSMEEINSMDSIDFSKIREGFDIPNLVSLMQLNLGEIEFPDIKEWAKKDFVPGANSKWNVDFKDFDKEETILHFKNLEEQRNQPGNDINNIDDINNIYFNNFDKEESILKYQDVTEQKDELSNDINDISDIEFSDFDKEESILQFKNVIEQKDEHINNVDLKDSSKDGTVLQFKDIITQKSEPKNGVNNVERLTEVKELVEVEGLTEVEKLTELTEIEELSLLSEEPLEDISIALKEVAYSFDSELEKDPEFVISMNEDDSDPVNNLLKLNPMEEYSAYMPKPLEEIAFSFSSEDSDREPEFTIRNISEDKDSNNNVTPEVTSKIAELEKISVQQTIVPEEIFIQDPLDETDTELMNNDIALEEPMLVEESIISDVVTEEEITPTNEELIMPESISEEILNIGQDQKEMILNNEEKTLSMDDNEIYEIEQNTIDQDIVDLDTPESLLMPSVTTNTHLIKTIDYPITEQTAPKKAIFPKIEDLEPNTDVISKAEEDEEVETTMKMIEDTYESFNINMQVVDFNRGPTITRFELEPPSGLKLRTILNLQDDLALQAGTSNLRIISPVEGRSLIGIEVPNKVRRNFLLREQIESNLFEESEAELPLILGIDVGGKEIVSDLATTPHLLIAGTTGSGKSVYVNALIMGLLFKLSSEDLKFIMIDPKMVELELYGGIPHLLAPIITKPEEAMAALEWTVQEMDRRYKLLSELSVRNIKEYKNLGKNSPTGDQGYEKLPYIVVIVDEFANLMLRAPKDTEKHISRLASMSRAVGIHLVLATQRPSVDVVTGIIKANFPSRIAFRVSSKIDSRTIIDRNGAETLLGRGDMLFMSPNYMDPVRIQSPYASSEDVARAVNTIKKNGPPDYAIDFSEVLARQEENNSDGSRTDAMSDPLFEEVLRYAVDNGEISASGIQRRFRVGYNRASRLIESMKDMKIISPPPSAGKGWLINITRDEIQSYLD